MTPWKPLQPGDLVDIVAPGWPCRPELVSPARDFLKSWGLRVRMPEGLLETWTFFANTDQKRGAFLKRALIAKDSKAVWCLRAASGTHRVLDDVFKIKRPKQSKLVVGFSDITALHLALHRKWSWASLHGSMLDRLAEGNLAAEIVQQLRDLVFGRLQTIEFSGLEPMNSGASKSKSLRGVLVGGNLTVLESLIGTPYLGSLKNKIVFFEDVGERGYRLDRSFFHCLQAGIFREVKAFVLGTFTGGDEPQSLVHAGSPPNLVSVALENFAELTKTPVFRGLPVGHGDLQWPLPLGYQAEISNRRLCIQLRGER